MDIYIESSYQRQYYTREKQRCRLLFQHAINYGLSSLTLVNNNEEKMKLIEFYKRRLDFPYVFGSLDSMGLPGLYIASPNDNPNIEEFKSIGISNGNINYNIRDLIEKANLLDIPVLITENNPDMSDYLNADVSSGVCQVSCRNFL